jgi:hypothetical protein
MAESKHTQQVSRKGWFPPFGLSMGSKQLQLLHDWLQLTAFHGRFLIHEVYM